MKIEKLNEILKDLNSLDQRFTKVSSNSQSDYYEEKDQGETGIKVEIYDIDEDGTFLKVVRETDSYGDNETVTEIQFVTKKLKEVLVYE